MSVIRLSDFRQDKHGMTPKSPVVICEGDNLHHLKLLPDNSVDSVVTDPPYGINYLAKDWDGSVPGLDLWREVLRVLKPGGYLLSFGATRTYHRMVVAVEDAGFEIRDQISWLYGQGMPKSRSFPGGQGTALKPAQEPIVVARKPFKGTIAANLLAHGVGVLNIDACRVPGDNPSMDRRKTARLTGNHPGKPGEQGSNLTNRVKFEAYAADKPGEALGRFPANVIHDGSPVSVEGIPAQFFYCAKPSPRERRENAHPTVKPVHLMRYLTRMVTPAGGTVLDPFAGSGTTGVAAVAEGFNVILMERDSGYAAIIRRRLKAGVAPVAA